MARCPSDWTPLDLTRAGKGAALAAFGAIAFSGKAIIVKLAYRYGTDAITLIALRMAFAFPLFAATALYQRFFVVSPPLERGDGWRILGLGFLGYYLASFLDFLGLTYVSATLERLILYLNPTLVLLMGLVLFGRRISARAIVALVLSYAGVVVALVDDARMGGSNTVLGSLLVFGSALSYAVYLLGSGQLVKRIGSLRLTAYASCIACGFCFIQFLATRHLGDLAELPAPVYSLSILNGVACTVLPVFAVMLAIARIGAAPAAQIGMIGPVSTIFLSWIFLGEHMGMPQIAGTALVLVGVFLVTWQTKKE